MVADRQNRVAGQASYRGDFIVDPVQQRVYPRDPKMIVAELE